MTGLKFKVDNKKNKSGLLTAFIVAFSVFISLTGAFINAAELNILTPFSFKTSVFDSLKYFCNQIFEVSEKYQAYKYIKFTTEPTGNYMPALLIIIAVTAVYFIVAAKRKSVLMYIIPALFFTGLQIYFGIFPGMLWSVAFYGSVAFAIICGREKISETAGGIILFLLLVTILYAGVYINYENKNPVLSELSETIRDKFDKKTELPPNDENLNNDENININEQNLDKQFAENHVNSNNDSQSDADKYKTESEENFSGSKIGAAVSQSLLFVLIIILIVILIFLVRLILLLTKSAKHRKLFDSSDCELAVNLMFTYLTKFLSEFGLEQKNTESQKNIFSSYSLQLESMISPKYSKEYLDMSEMWLETVYSNRKTTPETKKKMRDFLDKTPVLLSEKSNFFTRVKIKFYKFYK